MKFLVFFSIIFPSYSELAIGARDVLTMGKLRKLHRINFRITSVSESPSFTEYVNLCIKYKQIKPAITQAYSVNGM